MTVELQLGNGSAVSSTTTDANGRRYRYAHQPQIAQWNLLQLAEAIYPLIEDTQPLEQALQSYNDHYQQQSQTMMAAKLGFKTSSKTVHALSQDLLNLLTRVETDMTLFYRSLAKVNLASNIDSQSDYLQELFTPAWYRPEQLSDKYLADLKSWLRHYQSCASQINLAESERLETMNGANPKYVFRNYIAQQAIDRAEQDDFSMVNELLEVFKKPYDEQPEFEHYAARRPEWARHRAGCSMLSCSS